MRSSLFSRFSKLASCALAVLAITGASATYAGDAPSVAGSYAKSGPTAKDIKRLIMAGTPEMRAAATKIELGAMEQSKIDAVKKSNAERGVKKSLQIGISRVMSEEAPTKGQPKLRWNALPDGSRVAYLQVKSAGAKSLRVGLDLSNMPQGVEMRFVGTESSVDASAAADANELNTLKDDRSLYWTPVTEGDMQTIEIVAAKGVDTGALKFSVHTISHLIAGLKEGLSVLKAVNDCTVDVACAPASAAFNNVKEAVAHMVFQSGCGPGGAISTCVCTGTLLNDDVPTSDIPYFWSAHHCIETQTVANTLNFYWFYQNATCQNPRTTDVTRTGFPRTTGGAALLYSDVNSDGAFMRINGALPAGIYFAGWNANTIGIGENVTAIHHSDGDPKRYSLGVVDQFRSAPSLGANGSFIGVRYTLSTVLGGGSGGGVFTLNGNDYQLRGGLLGGTATCSNSGQPASAGNLDVYSRFDQIFPSIRQFLFTGGGGGNSTNYTDIWWNPNESGWGFQVNHHPGTGGSAGNIFGTWYTYDEAGNQLFILMSGCDLIAFNGTTCSGRLYRNEGTPYNVSTFAGSRNVRQIGVGTLQFSNSTTGTFTYTIGSTTISKNITRFAFGTGFANYPSDLSDVYYPAATPGWGLTIAQHGGTAFTVIYHYDEAGNPMFLTLTTTGTTTAGAGALFRSRSNGQSHYLTPTWRASDITATQVGDANFARSGATLSVRFNVNGFVQTRSLTPVPF